MNKYESGLLADILDGETQLEGPRNSKAVRAAEKSARAAARRIVQLIIAQKARGGALGSAIVAELSLFGMVEGK